MITDWQRYSFCGQPTNRTNTKIISAPDKGHAGLADISVSYIDNENVGDVNKFADFGVDYQSWAIGFAQNIDTIGGVAYVSYIHHDADGCLDVGGILGECDEGEELSGDLDTHHGRHASALLDDLL